MTSISERTLGRLSSVSVDDSSPTVRVAFFQELPSFKKGAVTTGRALPRRTSDFAALIADPERTPIALRKNVSQDLGRFGTSGRFPPSHPSSGTPFLPFMGRCICQPRDLLATMKHRDISRARWSPSSPNAPRG